MKNLQPGTNLSPTPVPGWYYVRMAYVNRTVEELSPDLLNSVVQITSGRTTSVGILASYAVIDADVSLVFFEGNHTATPNFTWKTSDGAKILVREWTDPNNA